MARRLTVSIRQMEDKYDLGDAYIDGSLELAHLWELLVERDNVPTITLTRKRVLMPIHLGFFIMREETRGKDRFKYSVVGIEEVEDEVPVSTTIPRKAPEEME